MSFKNEFRPPLPTCERHGSEWSRPTPYIHEPWGCLRCNAQRQKRIFVPYNEFCSYYLKKHNEVPRDYRTNLDSVSDVKDRGSSETAKE